MVSRLERLDRLPQLGQQGGPFVGAVNTDQSLGNQGRGLKQGSLATTERQQLNTRFIGTNLRSQHDKVRHGKCRHQRQGEKIPQRQPPSDQISCFQH